MNDELHDETTTERAPRRHRRLRAIGIGTAAAAVLSPLLAGTP